MRDLMGLLRVNWSPEMGGGGGGRRGMRGILLDATDVSTNSFIHSVGILSIQECSPRNLWRPFSYMITTHDVHQEDKREEQR